MLLSSCYTLIGHVGVSENIKESKKNGVFVYELRTDSNPFKINDTLAISIKEIWLENMWRYTKELKSQKDSGYQLCITLNSASLKGYNDKWVIGNNSYSAFGEDSDSSLFTELKSLPDTEELKYKIYEGSFEFDSIGKELGQFVLKKK